MIVNLFSPDGTRDNLYLSNYATIQLKDELSRLPGVGDITYLGQRDYSMRLWLDPEKMASRNLTASDVVQAIEQQNAQVAAGQIGQPPVATGQVVSIHDEHDGPAGRPRAVRRDDPQDRRDGRLVRLRDVARIELGAQGYDQTCTLDGKPSVALSIYQLPGSNALETAKRVRAKMEELEEPLPATASTTRSSTTRRRSSTNRSTKCSRRCATRSSWWPIVVLVFLQNWRSAIIPLVAVPVAIVGTFAVMAAMGFSLNNLTLFGLVLAIGIVVDDAIVVVEAVEHHIEHGLSPRDATIRAMEQVSGPGDRRRPGAQRRVRAVRVHQRHHRTVLPAVRPDDRGLDGHLGVQLADAQPGADGAVAAAARQAPCAAAAVAGVCDRRRLARLGVLERLAAERSQSFAVCGRLRTMRRGSAPWSARSPAASSRWPLNLLLGLGFSSRSTAAFDLHGAVLYLERRPAACGCQLARA